MKIVIEINAVRAVRAGTSGHDITSLTTLLILDVLGLHLNRFVVQRAAALLLQHLHQTLLGSAHVHDLLDQHVPAVTVFTLERLHRKRRVVGRCRVVLVRNRLTTGFRPQDQEGRHQSRDRRGDGQLKSLYNDEMEKVRTKHEKDFLALKVELQQEIKKFEKLQLQATKLQQQLSIVNDKNLDLMKENEFCKSKLRIMEEIRDERKSMLPPPAHARLCSNLKMEDEEGEIFNNTYLTDLKAGRMTSPVFGGRESVRYSELQQRNSMQPPHLKSSYLPQYTDGDLTDDDRVSSVRLQRKSSLRGTGAGDAASVNLDDSSTSLISRRKQGGTTSYKRPGPPTPSKKAGRLSFGGSLPTNDFQYKEIAKDANNASSNSATTTTSSLASRLSFGGGRKSNVDSSTALPGPASGTLAELNARRKTPGKFKQMFSSSNLLNTLHKDEIAPKAREVQSHDQFAGSTESPTDWSYYMLVLFAGLSFSSLVFSLYMHYVDYRVSRE
ncbi:conserved hypothetical protein [Culex quinquefasciatus]|uniref:Uncharacterized protein n=1 Tax=Culex quinquefasciatus TaxID=7176 RepID=B0XD84_CULQU|nr:conserved hypothetical protein [Culex quinquefasciatus]|eukprot:XP_001867606.1 conserved hypothetical protein [Culex quinquefasciatus]